MFLPFRVTTLLLIHYSLFDFNSCLPDTFVIDYRAHDEPYGMANMIQTFDNYSHSVLVGK